MLIKNEITNPVYGGKKCKLSHEIWYCLEMTQGSRRDRGMILKVGAIIVNHA